MVGYICTFLSEIWTLPLNLLNTNCNKIVKILAIYIITTVGIDSKDVALNKLLWHYNMYYGLVY
jgi:hypothetical protein